MLKIFVHKINDKKNKNKLQALSAEEIKKAGFFKDKNSRNLYIAGKYLTRKIIATQLKIKAEDIVFKTNKYGRPLLVYPKNKNFDFNLSHSGKRVVLAIADSRVGIDIEEMRPIDLKIAGDYFHKKETKFVHSQKGKELESFYQIWTLKESLIKAKGRGLSYSLKNFYFELRNNKIKLYSRFKKQSWRFWVYDLYPGYKIAVCVEGSESKPKLITCN
ncbi:MAG TPA: 4'-phosphopantetheinyl transferase superfamily protein [Candidatus Portnoybacteria bacterium]|nr:4'-phosphopantetheinyl transferase superfamily protein [Candidatus Portnoybacteria bacterium]